jgi:hypothetical protein
VLVLIFDWGHVQEIRRKDLRIRVVDIEVHVGMSEGSPGRW